MPFIKLQFKPGLNRDQTNYTGEGGWWAGDKIRFFSGYPQKIGGWVQNFPDTFLGICRQMFGWITSNSDNFLALGTTKKVYIESGTTFYDITPLRATTSAGDVTFAASAGSSVITVSDTAFGSSAGDFVTFSGVDANGLGAGGNITQAVLEQNYEIATVINANSYTIIAKSPTTGLPVTANASDSGNGGASVVGEYEIPVGNVVNIYGYGWGAGAWSRGTWGSGSGTPVVVLQRDWWFDNFDNDLVMNIRNGEIYYWVYNGIPSANRAVLLSSLAGATDVPETAMQILISQNDRHLLAFGCQPYNGSPGDFDPLLIRWASQDEPEKWEPLPTNSAGFIRVSRGSKIVRAIPSRQEIVVLTDTSVYSLQFLGTTDVFGLQELADNISILGPRAVTTINNVVYWMGQDKFFMYAGRVETLPCTLRNHVYQDLNFNQIDQIICSTNEAYTEVWWFYPSANSNTVDKYVVYNYVENVWYYGNMARTAWIDNPLRRYPQAVGYEQLLFDHELGNDANGAPLEAYIESNDFDIQQNDGETFILTRRMIPDINFDGSASSTPEVDLAIRPRNFPGSTQQADSFDTQRVVRTSVGTYTDQIFLRARARQMALKISSDQLGVQWQLGSPRLDIRSDGKQ